MTTRASSSSSTSDQQPLPKRQALTSQKVCIVCNCDSLTSEELYNIYIVEFNENSRKMRLRGEEEEEEEIPRNPALRMDSDFPFKMAFAVSKSMLYMFGGKGEGDSWETSSYSYDLSNYNKNNITSDTCNLKLTKDMLVQIHSMHSKKFLPKAVLLNNGKICVFSSILAHPEKRRRGFMVSDLNFELYNPDDNKWYRLPEPPIKFSADEICQVLNWFVVDNSLLFISTERGFFSIDLKAETTGVFREEKPEWKPQQLQIPNKKLPFSGLGLRVGDIVFAPSFVYFLNIPQVIESLGSCVSGRYFAEPIPYSDPGTGKNYSTRKCNFIRKDSGITHCPNLKTNDKELSFCVVHVGFEYLDYFIPTLLVDFLNCDVDKAKDLLDRDPFSNQTFSNTITNLDSGKFCLDGNLCDKIELLGVFPI